jgi:hypothetical protein
LCGGVVDGVEEAVRKEVLEVSLDPAASSFGTRSFFFGGWESIGLVVVVITRHEEKVQAAVICRSLHAAADR